METNKNGLQIPFPERIFSGKEERMKEEDSSSSNHKDGLYPVSKADRMRERQFRFRVHGTNTKYLKPYLKG